MVNTLVIFRRDNQNLNVQILCVRYELLTGISEAMNQIMFKI